MIKPKSVTSRYMAPEQLPWVAQLAEVWFAPKPFESIHLYEHLGVRLLKRYVPTGGDYFIQRFGVRIVTIRPDLNAMIHFEQLTRLYEAIHEIVFLVFSLFSLKRWRAHKTSFLNFLFAITIYLLLILSPAAIQRYNRIRAYRAIVRLAKR